MKLFLAFFCLICITCCRKENGVNQPGTSISQDSLWQLAWSEEFNYPGLPDSTKWTYETGFIRNSEPQYYQSKNINNSAVDGNYLNITALYNSTQTNKITSASIITKNRMNFLYGRIEVSAKMPVGSGAWPAIWLEGINRDTVDWPRCGELDMMEWLGVFPQYILGSIYTIATSGSDTSQVTPYTPQDFVTLSTRFHTYSIEWDSTQIKYFYDTVNYITYTAANLTAGEWEPFTKPMYFILNMAIGRSGGPIDYSKFPFTYQVDYVRYYKKR